jgi:hypothetical protein
VIIGLTTAETFEDAEDPTLLTAFTVNVYEPAELSPGTVALVDDPGTVTEWLPGVPVTT